MTKRKPILISTLVLALLASGYGAADYASVPNTPRTLFELASVSKQVAAVAILHLEQRKKLRVTDTLDRFFRGVPEDKRAIQLHHLPTHTSGLALSGVPYASTIRRDAYVKRYLFRKARMADSGFIGDRDLVKSKRVSVRRNNEPGSWTAADWHWGWGYKGMGGVVTTVLDMNR